MEKTRPCRSQTSGEIEHFHRVLVDGWAYVRFTPQETNAVMPWLNESTSTIATEPIILRQPAAPHTIDQPPRSVQS